MQIAKRAHYVVAIDIESKLLETARHRLAENKVKNCSFVAGNAYDLLKLLRHPMDFIFMANAFHRVPDKPRLCRVVYDALRPGGRFAIVNWHRQPRERTTVLGEPRGPRTELRVTSEDAHEGKLLVSVTLRVALSSDAAEEPYARSGWTMFDYAVGLFRRLNYGFAQEFFYIATCAERDQ